MAPVKRHAYKADFKLKAIRYALDAEIEQLQGNLM